MLLKILTERAVAVAKSSSQPSTPITASAPSPAAAVETKSAAMNNGKYQLEFYGIFKMIYY